MARLALLTLLATLAGCSWDWDRYAPNGSNPNRDAGDDLGLDAPDANTGCSSDNDCASDPSGHRVCNTATRACVACTPTHDACPQSQYCTTSNQCAPGCRDDNACASVPRDGGVSIDGAATGAPLRCNAATHACVECMANEHCPIGSLCMGMQCVPGCDLTRGCPTGLTCCNGGCVDTQATVTACGGCGTVCSVVNGSPACSGGRCAVARCNGVFGDCDNDGASCETNTSNTAAHCGMCGHACPARANATTSCDAGACAFTCNTGFADCDGDPSNGCEVNITTTVAHCGMCGHACAFTGATGICAGGACTLLACLSGFADCDGDPSNFCEVNLNTDVRNCRMCRAGCSLANATAQCTSGCSVGSCNAGFGNCDTTDANGCEAALDTDVANCGACGRSCAFPRATAVCRMGACAIGACEAGQGNCDGMELNGCETDTRTTAAHCGMCGNACPSRANATATCRSGACGFTCNPGFSDCDGNAANGCEVNTGADVSNCGACGTRCGNMNGTASCTAGVCGITCNTGFGDCDTSPANGCEVNLNVDNDAHCGMCGRACVGANAAERCVGRVCQVTSCTGSYFDCDRNAANGCEVDTVANDANCGACGNACTSGRTCQIGRCTRATLPTYVLSTPTVAWVDACAATGATTVLAFEDDTPYQGELPFPFEFYGGLTTNFFLSPNGTVGFGTLYFNINNLPEVLPFRSWGSLPSLNALTPAAYPLGVDLVNRSGICLATLGAAPSRRFVIENNDPQLYRSFAGELGDSHLTHEMILYEGTNVIDFLYGPSFSGPAGAAAVQSLTNVTVGLQTSSTTGVFRAVSYSGAITASTRIRFTQSP